MRTSVWFGDCVVFASMPNVHYLAKSHLLLVATQMCHQYGICCLHITTIEGVVCVHYVNQELKHWVSAEFFNPLHDLLYAVAVLED